MKRVSRVAAGIVTAWGMSFATALALQCKGPAHWDFSQEENCVDRVGRELFLHNSTCSNMWVLVQSLLSFRDTRYYHRGRYHESTSVHCLERTNYETAAMDGYRCILFSFVVSSSTLNSSTGSI